MRLITRRWKVPKVIWGLFILELPVTVAVLALFAIASPNLYRTKLWNDGYRNGFNSDPTEVLYSIVNGRPIATPLVWSQFVTNYNVTISVLSTFILLVKAVMFALHIFIPLLSVVIHALLAGLFGYSVYCQTAPDMSQPEFPQPGAPWYITKSCDVAFFPGDVGYCKQAKAAFAVSVAIIVLFSINTLVALWSAFPTKDERRGGNGTTKDHDDDNSSDTEQNSQNRWEMQQFPSSRQGNQAGLQNPVTPRTKAFNQLGGSGRDLPLRNGQ